MKIHSDLGTSCYLTPLNRTTANDPSKIQPPSGNQPIVSADEISYNVHAVLHLSRLLSGNFGVMVYAFITNKCMISRCAGSYVLYVGVYAKPFIQRKSNTKPIESNCVSYNPAKSTILL